MSFVNETMAFGESSQRVSIVQQPRSNNTPKPTGNIGTLVMKMQDITNNFERRRLLSALDDSQIILLNNRLYHAIKGKGNLNQIEKDILLAISQEIDASQRKVRWVAGSDIRIAKEANVSRYIPERGRVEYMSGGFTQISLLEKIS